MRSTSGRETAGLVAMIHSRRIAPDSAYRNIVIASVGGVHVGSEAGSTFQALAVSATWSALFQLRNATNSPLTPHSRVFWAVGWPFIWKTVEPGLPISPRIRWRLFTWTAVAVAWSDWYTPWRHVETSVGLVPRISAAASSRSSGMPVTLEVRSRGHGS